MTNLNSENADVEFERYIDAYNLSQASLPVDNLLNKQKRFNPVSGRNDVVFRMGNGGYIKIGEEDLPPPLQPVVDETLAQPPQMMTEAMQQPEVATKLPVSDIEIQGAQQFNEEQRRIGNIPTLEDFDAAGYSKEIVEAAGLGQPETIEPLTQEQIQQRLETGGIEIATTDPTIRESAANAMSRYLTDIALQDLREELQAQGASERTIQETLRTRENELFGEAEVITNAIWGHKSGIGVADFATAGILDIQEGYRLYEQSLYTGSNTDRVFGLLLMAAGVGGLGGVAKAVKRKLPAIRKAIADLGQGAEARIAERSTGTTLYSGFDPTLLTDPLFAYIGKRAGNPGNEEALTAISELTQGKKTKVEDLINYFEKEHINIHGRKLDPYVDEDFDVAVQAASNEVKYQMDEAISGRGWYDSDVKKTFETLSQVPGLERLADDETLRIIWSAFAAPTSIGNKVDLNTRAATAAFLQYLKTGKVPVDPPMKGATTEGIRGAGWGMKGKSVAAGMKVIAHLIDTKGPEGFADWWLSPHTLEELTNVRKAAGLSGGPSGLSGGKDSLHLGAMVLGDKTGRYSLNINGYQGTTKDLWFSRSYNRHFGDMRNPDGSIAGGPRNQTERRRMEEFTARMLDSIKEEGLTEQDAQAILWFYEQNLFTDLGVTSRPGSFSEAAEKIANELRSGVRTSDEIETGVEQAGEGLAGFREISAPKRTVRSERRSRQTDGEAFGPYTRGSGEGAEGTGLLVLNPDEQTQRIYNEAGISLPSIKEQPAADTAVQYNADMTEAMAGHTYGAQVEIKSAEELASARLFKTENGSGFAIKPDGDIVAVFQSGNETGSVGYAMIQAAVQAGGRKLDAFDTFLPGIYETAGFRPVAKLPWNDEFAPDNWSKETFKNFNNGEPDVVFFVYDPNYFGGATDVPKFTDYDDAVAAQDAEIARLKETIDGY